MAVAGFHGLPLAGCVLEPPTPNGQVGAVLGVPSAILGLDEPEASVRQEAERLSVVIHDVQTAIGVNLPPKSNRR